MLSLVTLHECGSGSACRSQDEGASTGTRPERTASAIVAASDTRVAPGRRDAMRCAYLIHPQYGHPMRSLVREPEAFILRPHGIGEGPAAGNDQQAMLARHLADDRQDGIEASVVGEKSTADLHDRLNDGRLLNVERGLQPPRHPIRRSLGEGGSLRSTI